MGADFVEEITSRDPDRVNSTIDQVKEMDQQDRAELFKGQFEDLLLSYKRGDGYQRLSVTRFLKALFSPELTQEDRRALWNFLKRAVQDDDGRVRISAIKGIRMFAAVCSVLEEDLKPLLDELKKIASKHHGKKREHIEQAIYTFERLLDPLHQRLMEGLLNSLGES